jgi:hypothetical protein
MQHLYGSLDIWSQPSDSDELPIRTLDTKQNSWRKQTYSFVLSRPAALAFCRFHNFDVTPAHLPNLVDLLTSLSDDVAYQFVRNIELLCLTSCSRGS